ncbi:hypothetical protein MKW98_025420, partial [Papaver atlanticum]
ATIIQRLFSIPLPPILYFRSSLLTGGGLKDPLEDEIQSSPTTFLKSLEAMGAEKPVMPCGIGGPIETLRWNHRISGPALTMLLEIITYLLTKDLLMRMPLRCYHHSLCLPMIEFHQIRAQVRISNIMKKVQQKKLQMMHTPENQISVTT